MFFPPIIILLFQDVAIAQIMMIYEDTEIKTANGTIKNEPQNQLDFCVLCSNIIDAILGSFATGTGDTGESLKSVKSSIKKVIQTFESFRKCEYAYFFRNARKEQEFSMECALALCFLRQSRLENK